MKRILFFLLLLVNLQLTTDNGSLSIGFGEVSAQRVQEEQLSKVTTRGWGDQWECPYCKNWFYGYDDKNRQDHIYYECKGYNTNCLQCNELIPYDKISWHMDKECRFRIVKCPKCDEFCFAYEIEWGSHVCTFRCTCCGRPLGYGEYCDCGCDLEAIGEKPWWMKEGYPGEGGITGGRFDGGDISGGNGNNGASQSELESRIHKHMSLKELRHKGGVKLLGNRTSTKASKKLYEMEVLHPQHIRGECVARAFAFIAELNGGDYNKVFNKLYNKILDVGGISHWDDHGSTTLFNEYINIVEYKNDFETVANLIDNGIPVACSANDFPFHMEVIIGYDDKYYYVAAGNRDGDVSVVSRMSVNCNYVYGIK